MVKHMPKRQEFTAYKGILLYAPLNTPLPGTPAAPAVGALPAEALAACVARAAVPDRSRRRPPTRPPSARMKKKYIVALTEAERRMLQEMLSRGKASARKLTRAHILLKADAGPAGPDGAGWDDQAIAQALGAGRATVERVRKAFVEEGLEAALERRRPRRLYDRRLDGDAEVHLIALACQKPPEGRGRWTLRLLAERMVELQCVEQVSYQTVRRTLKERT